MTDAKMKQVLYSAIDVDNALSKITESDEVVMIITAAINKWCNYDEIKALGMAVLIAKLIQEAAEEQENGK